MKYASSHIYVLSKFSVDYLFLDGLYMQTRWKCDCSKIFSFEAKGPAEGFIEKAIKADVNI